MNGESGVLEFVITVLIGLIFIAFAAVVGAIVPGWVVPVRKTTDIVTQASPATVMNASAVKVFLAQGRNRLACPCPGVQGCR